MKLLVGLCLLGFFVGLVLCSHRRDSHRVRFGQHLHEASKSKLSGSGFSKHKLDQGESLFKVPKCGIVPKVKHQYAVKYKPIVPFGQVPWQAGIFYAKDDSFLCSGTLISPHHVITAAFCLISIEDHSSLVVRLGDWDITKRDSPYEAYEHYTGSVGAVSVLPAGPGIDGMNEVSSIPTVAVLKLKENIDFQNYPHIAPICLPAPNRNRNPKNNIDSQPKLNNPGNPWKSTYKECYVSGWGIQNQEKMPDEDLSHLPDEVSSFIHRSTHNPPAPVSDLIDNEQKESNPVVRSLSLAPSLKPSEPISISIPIISDPDQKAIYMASNPTGDLFNSSEVFGEQSNKPGSDMLNQKEEHLQNSFDLLQAIDPLNHAEDMMPPATKAYRPLPTQHGTETTSTPILNVTKRSEVISESGLLERVKEERKREDSLEYSYLDTTEPVLTDDTMFRHKQKYKSGKKGPGSSFHTTNFGEVHQTTPFPLGSTGHSSEDVDFLNKQSQFNFTEFIFPFSNSIYDNPFPKIRVTLKWARVTFQRKCTDFSPVGKSCVVPANVDTDSSLCMADLGSGITCEQDKNAAVSHTSIRTRRRRNKSRTREEERTHRVEPSAPTTRSVLAGVVTWKRPCFDNDTDPSANMTIVTDIKHFLPALLEIINSDN